MKARRVVLRHVTGVRIGRTFAIAAHEVTVEQFQAFRADHDGSRQYSREADAPVNTVTWYQAAQYCNWLSQQEGLPEDQWCYDPQQAFADGMRLYPDYLQRTGYRLPTEAEWEFACRALATTARPYGETTALLGKYAWYIENSQQRWMLPVGSLKPNDFGLFDMLGNALEWCQDRAAYYPTDRPLVEDAEQVGEVRDSESRVVRGGSFFITRTVSCGRPTAALLCRTTVTSTSVSAWRGLTPDLLYPFALLGTAWAKHRQVTRRLASRLLRAATDARNVRMGDRLDEYVAVTLPF